MSRKSFKTFVYLIFLNFGKTVKVGKFLIQQKEKTKSIKFTKILKLEKFLKCKENLRILENSNYMVKSTRDG